MRRLPILTFHSVDPSGSVISMPPRDFGRIMRQLAEAGWQGQTVGSALAARRHDPDTRRPLGLSFDDAYANLRTEALPVLRDLGFTATVFVIAGRCGLNNDWPGQPSSIPRMDLLDWPDLEALLQAGWEVGAHGMNHLPLTAMTPAQAARDLDESKALLERHLRIPVPVFAYPYGVHTDAVRRLARERYEAACGARLALASADDLRAPFELPRIDAYYLRRFPPVAIDSLAGRGYLAGRRWARRLRQPPWDRQALGEAARNG